MFSRNLSGIPCAWAIRSAFTVARTSPLFALVPKVLSTIRLPGPAWDELDDVEVVRALTEPRADAEVLIVPNQTVDARVLDLLPSLRLVANFSVGYDRIDLDACRARAVAVTNTPGVLDAATADLAFALILSARRRVVEGDRHVRAGDWAGGWFTGPFLGLEVS